MIMNDEFWKNNRVRNKTLLIVEGNHEKDIFMNRLLKSFPEINIDKNNIVVYCTNIYVLLSKIKDEYGDDWFEQDINLPWLITKDKSIKEDKKNYTDIYLIFDYERHDPNFSEDGITKMQKYFSSPEDVGKLYINYPMIESYMDLSDIKDENYLHKLTLTDIDRGASYKNSVSNTPIAKLVDFPNKIYEILCNRFSVDNKVSEKFVDILLEETDLDNIKSKVNSFLGNYICEKKLKTFLGQLCHEINRNNFLNDENNYHTYMRYVFAQIACHNIKKANIVQLGVCKQSGNLRDDYESIDMCKILDKQNEKSMCDKMVYVLNTSILILPDYNLNLIL